MVQSLGVAGRTVVSVWSVVWADIVGFSIIVPSDDFEEFKVVLHLEDLFPSVVPEGLRVEEPVFGIGDFFAKVRVDYGSAGSP